MQKIFKTKLINTPIGVMIAIASPKHLYLLDFVDSKNLSNNLKRILTSSIAKLESGNNQILDSIEYELEQYFDGTLKQFTTDFMICGTEFQVSVWSQLRKINFGQTESYKNIAQQIYKPNAFRAVANANSLNALAIVMPCHRVVNSNGSLGGYAGGINRKKWLLQHEKLL